RAARGVVIAAAADKRRARDPGSAERAAAHYRAAAQPMPACDVIPYVCHSVPSLCSPVGRRCASPQTQNVRLRRRRTPYESRNRYMNEQVYNDCRVIRRNQPRTAVGPRLSTRRSSRTCCYGALITTRKTAANARASPGAILEGLRG